MIDMTFNYEQFQNVAYRFVSTKLGNKELSVRIIMITDMV